MANELTPQNEPKPTPPKRGRIRGIPDITKMQGILTMQARVYREMHTGKVSARDGFLRITALREIRATVEAMTLTDRLAELEELVRLQGNMAQPIQGDWRPAHA